MIKQANPLTAALRIAGQQVGRAGRFAGRKANWGTQNYSALLKRLLSRVSTPIEPSSSKKLETLIGDISRQLPQGTPRLRLQAPPRGLDLQLPGRGVPGSRKYIHPGVMHGSRRHSRIVEPMVGSLGQGPIPSPAPSTPVPTKDLLRRALATLGLQTGSAAGGAWGLKSILGAESNDLPTYNHKR